MQYFATSDIGLRQDNRGTDARKRNNLLLYFSEFDASPVSPTQYTDSSITVEVPNTLPGSFAVRVSVNGRTSNSVEFTLE